MRVTYSEGEVSVNTVHHYATEKRVAGAYTYTTLHISSPTEMIKDPRF